MTKTKASPAQLLRKRMVHDPSSPVAKLMLEVDSQWFHDHPGETVMFRQSVNGESPILDLILAQGGATAAWMLVEKTETNELTMRPVCEQNGIRSVMYSAKVPLSDRLPFFDIGKLATDKPEADPHEKEASDVVH